MKSGEVQFVLAVCVGAFAETPKYFAFEIGAGGAYDLNTAEVLGSNQMGFTYSFNETFAGGFTFITVGANSIDVLELSIVPGLANMSISMYMGQVATAVGFGVGIGYDFLVEAEDFFTSFGLYVDWYAGNGGAYSVSTGGILSLGVRTKIGL